MFSFAGATLGYGVSSIPAPAAASPGDLLVAMVSGNPPTSGTWTVIATNDQSDALLCKIATGSSDDARGSNVSGTMAAYRGVGMPTAYSLAFQNAIVSTAITGAAVAGAGLVLAGFSSHGGGGDIVIAASGGFTQDYEANALPSAPTDPWPMMWAHKAVSGSVTPTAVGSGRAGGLGWGGAVAGLAVPLLSAGEGMLL